MKKILILVASTLLLITSAQGFAATGSFGEQSAVILSSSIVQGVIQAAEAKYNTTLREISIDDKVDQMMLGVHAYNVYLKFQQGRGVGQKVSCAVSVGVKVGASIHSSAPASVKASDYCEVVTN